MRLYNALVEAGDPETIDLFLREEEVQHTLEGCLRDEPEWRAAYGVRRAGGGELAKLNVLSETTRPLTCNERLGRVRP
jgi:hypothetical protein